MRIGVTSDLVGDGIPVVELAREVEAAGLESLFVTEHTHVPLSSRDVLAEDDHGSDHALLEPLVALGAAAAVTRTLRLGTAISLVAQHDPISLAKAVATLDVLSGGRFVFGVGPGWLEQEMRNHGLEPADRWKVMREHVLAMQALWRDDEAAFHGKFVDFDPVLFGPKPVQRPWPPVLIAGNPGRRVLERVVEYGDGWMPIVDSADELVPWMDELAEMCVAAGRPKLPVTAALWAPDEALLARCAELGVERCLIWLPVADLATTRATLARYAEVARRFASGLDADPDWSPPRVDDVDLRDVERRRLAALVTGDMPAAEALHADDYELISPGGDRHSKRDYLDDIASGALTYQVFEPASEIRVRSIGPTAAGVRYRARILVHGDGWTDGGVFMHTDIYERREGRWLAVWSQATRISRRGSERAE